MADLVPEICDELGVAVSVHDPQRGEIQHVNSQFASLTGYSASAIAELELSEFTLDDAGVTAAELRQQVQDAAEGEPRTVEWTVRAADGGRRHLELRLSATTLDGDPYVLGKIQDMSAEQARTERLETQTEAFRTLHQTIARSAPFEAKIRDLLAFGRELLAVEQGFYTRIDGDRQEVVVGVGPNDQLQTGATAPVADSYCKHTVGPASETPLAVLDAANSEWIDDAAYDRFGLDCYIGSTVVVDDEPVGTVCFADRTPRDREFTDIQETFVEFLAKWARYELERTERESKFKRLTERISDAYYAVDTEFTVTYWNDSIADRLSIPAEEVLGETLWDHVPHLEETVVEDRLREAIETGEQTTCEYYYEPADYWMLLQIYPDDDGLGVIVKDITDRKEYEAQLERSNERLQEFAYILSHDLQEPLRMVSSYVCLLEDELEDELDAETREFIDFAVEGTERMRGMIDGLLLYSRVETEGSTFTETDVEAVLDSVRTDLELKVMEADAEIVVDSLPTVHADADQLGQLFQNLLKNAIEHGGEGTTIEITAEEIDGGHQFAVSDDGPGIPTDKQADIFGLFDKGRDSDGTGIGLAVCERIVNRHNGDIWVESEPGNGTMFYFTLSNEQ